MEFCDVMLLVIAGGLIGGLADFMKAFTARKGGVNYDEEEFTRQHLWLLIPSLLIGVASAIAIQLIFEFLHAFREGGDMLENQLFMLSVSVIAGFSGRRFLPGISDHLEQQISHVKAKAEKDISQVKEETEKQIGEIQSTTQKLKETMENLAEETEKMRQRNEQTKALTEQFEQELKDKVSQLKNLDEQMEQRISRVDQNTQTIKVETQSIDSILRAIATLGRGAAADPQEILQCIDELNLRFAQNPIHRMLTVVLGRLYKARGDYPSAIDVLSKFLNKKRLNKELDKDFADVLYNLACYVCLMNVEAPDERLMDAIIDALREAIQISPANRNTARTDPDFDSIRTNPRFIELLAEPAKS